MSDDQRKHILDGDEFPAAWSDDQLIDAIMDVANDPEPRRLFEALALKWVCTTAMRGEGCGGSKALSCPSDAWNVMRRFEPTLAAAERGQ